ncbi:hypothetical protein SAMN05421686_104149 [Thalassolituus maritimus]|uniref:Uncharacterized protein n=1 Tax=Thalassolituus maritimus TaxID=484498 RepID=A0A1N7LQ92_9GAMM|nr:hypothetical protein [Thalassolituus maritimus]SIS75939.1 hypothetical protein SAMN05421686_104149 [Thalassolituus maritimus]
MKLYNFLEASEFNALKHRMGADGYGHFVEFDPEHQLTFGERDQLARGVLMALPGQLRILPDRTLALKNSRVWIEGEGQIHLAACHELHRLRDADSIKASTRDPEKTFSICPDCLAELKYLGLDGRKSRRLSEQLDELFSMARFRQDYPFYPV